MAQSQVGDVQLFVSSLIPRTDNSPVVFNGDLKYSKTVIDFNAAYTWHMKTKSILKTDTVSISVFWQQVTKEVLFIDDEMLDKCNLQDKHQSCLKEINDMIRIYSKSGIIVDEYFQYLNKLFAQYAPVRLDIPSGSVIVLKKLLKAEQVLNGMVQLKEQEHTFDIDVFTSNEFLTPEDFRYKNIMLLIKEMQAGYYSFREHSIVINNGKGNKAHTYRLGQDVTITLRDREVVKVEAIETKHNLVNVNGDWRIQKPDGTLCATQDFQAVVIESVPDSEDKVIKLYGAYTHILRNVLGFKPQSWQYEYLIGENRLNAIAGTRRAGKTLLSSYLVFRQMYCSPKSVKHAQRQQKVIYIAPSSDKFKAFIDYIESSAKRIKVLNVFKYDKTTNRMELVDEVVAFNGNKTNQVVATCDLVSAKGYEPARSNGGDLIICDEASFIPDDVYLNFLPILENEQATLFAISTINWETPKHWFYEFLMNMEQGNDADGFAIRVTIDDIDNAVIPATSKERMKEALKGNMQRYYAELYATFPTIHSVFNTTNLFIMPDQKRGYRVLQVIIGYDPAKRSDYGGVIVSEVREITDPATLKPIQQLVFTDEYRLTGDYSTSQRNFLANLKQWFISRGIKTTLIMDATVVGDVVAEIMGNLVDYKVWYTGSGQRPDIDKYGMWRYPKTRLVNLMQALVDSGMVKAYSTLTTLIEELKNFKSHTSAAGNIQFDSLTWHDDLVNAGMLCCFEFGMINGNYYSVSSEFNKDYKDLIDNALQKKTNLYNSYYGHYDRTSKTNKSYTF